jgi:hypothetical protein
LDWNELLVRVTAETSARRPLDCIVEMRQRRSHGRLARSVCRRDRRLDWKSRRRPRPIVTGKAWRRRRERNAPRHLGATIMLRQLATEPRFDEAERCVVTTTVGAKYRFVAFGDDGEAAILARIERALELSSAEWLEHQASGGDRSTVDLYLDDAVQRTEVPEPQPIDLPRTREHMPRFAFLQSSAIVRYDVDTEITDTHRISFEAAFAELPGFDAI